MPEISWLALYSATILLGSLLGGYVPFVGQVTHSRLQFYLSFSAGVMLGAAFFHVMPEAMAMCGSPENFGWWMSVGVVGMFCIERFIAPHSHETDGGGAHDDAGDHGTHHEHEAGNAGRARALAQEPRAAAPAVAGWMAVLGLTIHTFMNGVGLAGEVQHDLRLRSSMPSEALLALGLPGLAMFAAIAFHKPADALAISTVLSRKGVSRKKLMLVQFGFALMVPVGAAAFLLAREALAEGLESQLAGAALAFSAGTFLFIALSDLLPEVQFHRHDRLPLLLTLALGVMLMGAIGYLEKRSHGDQSRGRSGEPAN